MKISNFLRKATAPDKVPKNMQDSLNTYSKMSEEELFSKFKETVAQEKANGTFDLNALENFYNTASIMLTPEQKAKMRLLIDEISK